MTSNPPQQSLPVAADLPRPGSFTWLMVCLQSVRAVWASAVTLSVFGGLFVADMPYSIANRRKLLLFYVGMPLAAALLHQVLGRKEPLTARRVRLRAIIAATVAIYSLSVLLEALPLGHALFMIFFPTAWPVAAALGVALVLLGLVLTARRVRAGDHRVHFLVPGRVHLALGVALAGVIATLSIAKMFFPHNAQRCAAYEEQPGVRLMLPAGELMHRHLEGWANVYQLLYAGETDTVYASFKYWAGMHFFVDPTERSHALVAVRRSGDVDVVTFTGDEAPEYLAFDPTTRLLYLAAFKPNADHDLHVYRDDGRSLSLVTKVRLPLPYDQPGALSVDPEARRLYVFDNHASVLIYDIVADDQLELLERRPLAADLPLVWDVVETGPGRGYLAAFEHPDVFVDVPNGVARTLPDGWGAIGGGWDPAAERAVVVDILEGTARVYDGSGTLQQTVPVGVRGRDGLWISKHSILAVGGYAHGRLDLHDTATLQRVASLDVGGPLRALVSDGDTLFAGTSCGVVAVDVQAARAAQTDTR